jgi:hypothetical protein
MAGSCRSTNPKVSPSNPDRRPGPATPPEHRGDQSAVDSRAALKHLRGLAYARIAKPVVPVKTDDEEYPWR